MNRSTGILVTVLVALGIVAYMILQRPGESSSTGQLGERLVQYDSAAVDRLEISSPSLRVTLAREGGTWMLIEPLRAKADEAAVTAAVGKGNHIELKTLVSSNRGKRSLFQVDSTGTLVRVFERGTEKALFRVGKTGGSYTETYVRKEDADNVYLADGMFGYTFNRQPREWRDRNVYKAEREAVTSIRFHYGDTTFTLALRDSVWALDGDSTVESAVRGFLSSLTTLQADDFIDTVLVPLPRLVAMLEVNGTQIRFHEEKGATVYVVQSSASPQLYTMQPWRVTGVLKRKKDFLPQAV
jgi:hypothetical protein